MAEQLRKVGRWTVALTLATSFMLANVPLSYAGPGDTNSVNTGQNIADGEYYNTKHNETVFTNPDSLRIDHGVTVRLLEVDAAGNKTGNGGNGFFQTNGVIQVDGTINALALMQNGQNGNIRIDAPFLFQNGTILGGSIITNVGNMVLGPNAHIEAVGSPGKPGQITINNTPLPVGAVVDGTGRIIGSYNTGVIQIKGDIVNLDGVVMAKGVNPGDAGGRVNISGTEVKIGPNGRLIADGADGKWGVDGGKGGIVQMHATQTFQNDGVVSVNGGKGYNGDHPTNGGDGGLIEAFGNTTAVNNGKLTANGGNGGTNPTVQIGGEWEGHQVSDGQKGGNGGNGGAVLFGFNPDQKSLVKPDFVPVNNGSIEVKGGDGGHGQDALANDPKLPQVARGGYGGDGGTGGLVHFYGIPSEPSIANVQYGGGHGGQGGAASITKACGCATPGAGGACGGPGQIVMEPVPPQPPIIPPPPNTPPNTPLFPLYPKEYQSLGDALPGRQSQVLSYNKSIFMVRAPLPVIQKRTPPPPPPPEPVKVMVAKPKPKPPQKKVPVRGYW